jgi:hypothetical protein
LYKISPVSTKPYKCSSLKLNMSQIVVSPLSASQQKDGFIHKI